MTSSRTEKEEAEPSLWEHLNDFAEHTTMHGVARVGSYETSRIARVFWLSLVLCAAGWAIYNVVLIIMTFFTFPVSTVVTLKFDDTVAFPAITICNLNQIRKSQFVGNEKLNKLKTEVEVPIISCLSGSVTLFLLTIRGTLRKAYTAHLQQSYKKLNESPFERAQPPTQSVSSSYTTAEITTATTAATTEDNATDSTTTFSSSSGNTPDFDVAGDFGAPLTTSEYSTLGDVSTESDGTSSSPQSTTASLYGEAGYNYADNDNDNGNVKEEEDYDYIFEYLEDYAFEGYLDPFLNWTLWDYGPDYDEQSRTQIRSFLDQLAVSERFEFGHHMGKMLLDCRYHRSQKCSSRNFTDFYNHYFGNCYTFNKEVVADVVSKPGPSHGLSLLLNVESEEYMKQSQTVGFKVVIHPSDTMPFPEDEGIIVSPGFATSIAVMRMDLKRSPPPYGQCRDYGEKENLDVNMYAMPPYKVGYSDKACQRTCYQRKVIETCKCCDLEYPCLERSQALSGAGSVSFCLEDEEMSCLHQVNDDFERGVSGCEDDCLPACEETTFTEEVSMGVWPSEAALEELQTKLTMLPTVLLERYNKTDVTFFRKNLAKVDIYFKQLNYELIETEPAYNWYRLLSDLGGQLGLWLGFSILTAVEFLELACVLIRHVIRKLRHTGTDLGRALMNSGEKVNAVHV